MDAVGADGDGGPPKPNCYASFAYSGQIAWAQRAQVQNNAGFNGWWNNGAPLELVADACVDRRIDG